MVVPTCFTIAAWTYALCVNFVPSYRNPADKIETAKVDIQNTKSKEEIRDNVERIVENDIEKNIEEIR